MNNSNKSRKLQQISLTAHTEHRAWGCTHLWFHPTLRHICRWTHLCSALPELPSYDSISPNLDHLCLYKFTIMQPSDGRLAIIVSHLARKRCPLFWFQNCFARTYWHCWKCMKMKTWLKQWESSANLCLLICYGYMSTKVALLTFSGTSSIINYVNIGQAGKTKDTK